LLMIEKQPSYNAIMMDRMKYFYDMNYLSVTTVWYHQDSFKNQHYEI